jgi:hypothetical protein
MEKLRREQIATKDGANSAHYQVGQVVRRTIQELDGTRCDKGSCWCAARQASVPNNQSCGTTIPVNDPQLQPVHNSNGSAIYFALPSWSAAVDAANPGVPTGQALTCVGDDQRFVARPQDGDGNGTARTALPGLRVDKALAPSGRLPDPVDIPGLAPIDRESLLPTKGLFSELIQQNAEALPVSGDRTLGRQ